MAPLLHRAAITKTGTNDSARPNTAVTGYHGEADVGLLECGSVVGTIAGDRDHLAVVSQLAVNDALHQRVLVLRRRPSQHSQPRPHRVKLGRVHILQTTRHPRTQTDRRS